MSLHRVFALVLAVVALATGPTSAHALQDERAAPPPLLEELERLCLRAKGDHVWTWSWARASGFEDMDPSAVTTFSLWGFARDLRGMTRTVDGVEYRLMTAIGGSRPVGSDARTDGHQATFCWVSARPQDRRRTVADVGRLLRVPSYRVGNSRLFPWLEQDGERRRVSRTAFERDFHRLVREDHMQLVSVTHDKDWVHLGYFRRRDPAAEPDSLGRY
ncbi:hypothetical protein ACO2Q1_02880 [Brevundimonas sp. VNH65]|uniref:hypothetical protein n=1 Tax=Brevundimonas sp. VNH65 TaxID=3400917 RepID=UPI003C05C82D